MGYFGCMPRSLKYSICAKVSSLKKVSEKLRMDNRKRMHDRLRKLGRVSTRIPEIDYYTFVLSSVPLKQEEYCKSIKKSLK